MTPVFVGGSSRSGTTLLGAMLGAHSECLTVPESQFIIELLDGSDWDKDRINVTQVLNAIKNHWRFKLWDLNIEIPLDFEERVGTSYSQLIEWIVRTYGEKLGKAAPRIWVDHTPWNLKYACRLFELFPEARMIHILRDGRAVASSIMKLDWGPNEIYGAAHKWVEEVAYGLAAEAFWGGKRVTQVRYEDLVQEPEVILKRLCAFLTIDYQPQMTKASGFRVPKYTSEQHALVGRKPDSQRATAWEKELTSRQIEIFENTTGDLLYHLGYTLKFGREAKAITRMEKRLLDVRELYKRGINVLRKHRRISRSISDGSRR